MPPDAPLRLRAARAFVIAVALQALFVFFFVFPAHKPAPNDLPVVVAGSVPDAEAFAARLRAQGDFEALHVLDERRARRFVLDRDAYGAFVLDRRGRLRRVVVASAASLPAAQLLTELGRRAGASEVVDLRPLPREDPRGLTLNILVLALVITAILGALALVSVVPDLGPRGRIALIAASAAAGAVSAIAIVKWGLDALPGPWLAEVAVVALAVAAIGLAAAGIIDLLGPVGIPIAFLVFLMLGNPASGAATAPELLPTPWEPLGRLLPPGALGSALRGTAYFGGAGTLGPLTVLLAWAAAGVGLALLSGRGATRSGPPPPGAPGAPRGPAS